MELLMHDTSRMLAQRRRRQGLNRTADSRQWIWVVDFAGFGWRDQNPQSGILTAKLLAHFPEYLHLGILVNAPLVFRAMYRLIVPFLDERTQSKVLFVNGSSRDEWMAVLEPRIGRRAATWICNETDENEQMRNKRTGTANGDQQWKRYWIPPTDPTAHDARGMPDYVNSPYYMKTPGDAYEEMRQKQQQQQQQ